jgi:hypothetical protein
MPWPLKDRAKDMEKEQQRQVDKAQEEQKQQTGKKEK